MADFFKIRPVVATDFEQWQELWQIYNKFYGRDDFPAEITKLTWFRFFDDNEPVHALVAEQNGVMLGFTHYLFHRSTSRIELSCYLQDLLVNDTSRGQGVGRRLIEAVYEQARIVGSRRVYWQTHESNATARKLYDNVAELSGFIVYAKDL